MNAPQHKDMDEAAPWTDPTLMLSLLEDIDALDASSTGAFVLGEERKPLGVVFVQHARICWAVSALMRGRLTDLLVQAGGGEVDRVALERIYQECRAQGVPLGDTLVGRGIVSAAKMRQALLTHTCEALLSCAPMSRQRWRFRVHSEPSYDATNTFSAAEVFVGLAAVQAPGRLERAHAGLRRHVPATACGVAFVRDGGGVPIALHACSLAPLELVELGRFTANTVDIAGALCRDASVVMSRGGESLVLWQHDALLYLAACTDAADAAFVVATHTRPTHP